MHFGVISRQVMSETIDGETIIIHLGTGSYYSLQKAGVDVWAAVARGANEAQVLDELAQRYKAPRAQLEASIADLIRELQAENLSRGERRGEHLPAPGGSPGRAAGVRGAASREAHRHAGHHPARPGCTRSTTEAGHTRPRLRSGESRRLTSLTGGGLDACSRGHGARLRGAATDTS